MTLFRWFFFSFALVGGAAWAGTVHLVNDSMYTLRAEVRGADGTFLGGFVIKPEHTMRWTDTYGHVGHFGKGNIFHEQSTRSQTPYQVRWLCMNGNDFSICNAVATGGIVTASSCEGRRICSPEESKTQEERQ